MKKLRVFLFFIILSLLTYHLSLITVFADDATSSSSLDPRIKQKLQDLQQEIASKAAVLKLEINKKLLNRAYVGKVRKLSGFNLVISTKSGEKLVKLNQDTEYLAESRKKLTIKELEVGDFIASLGDIDESETLMAKRVIWIKEAQPTKLVFWGQLESTQSADLAVKDREGKDWSIQTNSNTDLRSADHDISLSEITKGAVIIVGTKKSDQRILASLIYLFPKTSAASFSASFKSLTVSTARQ